MRQWLLHDPRLRRPPGAADRAHGRREARLERALHARRARVLYDRVLRLDPRAPTIPSATASCSPRATARRRSTRSSRRRASSTSTDLAGFGRLRLAAGLTTPTACSCPAWRSRAGRSATACPSRWARPSASEARGRERARVFCLVGDAELDEGSNWEAVQLAGRLGLSRLTVAWSTTARPPTTGRAAIAARFELEGWSAARVDGRDHDALERGRGRRPVSARTSSWRRWSDDTMRQRFYELADGAPRPRSAHRRSSSRRSASGELPRHERAVQRRHPRAAHDRRRRRPRARGTATRRALLRAVRRASARPPRRPGASDEPRRSTVRPSACTGAALDSSDIRM